jgi:transposase
LDVVRREPALFGHTQSRWTLKRIAQSCDWLRVTTEAGLSQLLKRLGIEYKRARDYVHSPDRHYPAKVGYLTLCRMRAWYEPERYVFVYLDEFTFYRQPSLAQAYEARGHVQPLARQSYRSNTRCRGIGALNAVTGQVTYRQYSKISLARLSHFYAVLREAYPDAETIYVAQDNWPIHVHPDVLARLEPQSSPFWPLLPASWPTTARPRAVHDHLPIQLVFLPTYASWLNPIEKLWRWVRQEVLHLHRLSDEWALLKQRVVDFMAQFLDGSVALLRYVGLLPN